MQLSEMKAFSKKGRGDFYPVEEATSHEQEKDALVEELKATQVSVRSVPEEEANAVIRTFRSEPQILVGQEKTIYCGAKLYVRADEGGNFVTYNGTVKGKPWCREEHEEWAQHPLSEQGLRFNTNFKDFFFVIEKKE